VRVGATVKERGGEEVFIASQPAVIEKLSIIAN
jgi:hypothetical protein